MLYQNSQGVEIDLDTKLPDLIYYYKDFYSSFGFIIFTTWLF